MPTSSRTFLSGGKHGQVHVWELSRTEPAAILLPPHHGGGPVEPNVGVITCLEVVGGHFVLAGAYNQGINVWDLRSASDSPSATSSSAASGLLLLLATAIVSLNVFVMLQWLGVGLLSPGICCDNCLSHPPRHPAQRRGSHLRWALL